MSTQMAWRHRRGDRALTRPSVVITGGGTGGHVYPGLAVAAALARLEKADAAPSADVHYVGSAGGMERELALRAGLRFEAVATGALLGRGRAAQAASAVALMRGIGQTLGLLRRWRVGAILATGGYVSAPVVLGGWLARVPTLIYLPDVEPGLAVKFLSRFARRVAVTSDHSRRFLPAGKAVVTGYPLRRELLAAGRQESRSLLGVGPRDKVLLILGGSLGAHSINAAVVGALPALLERAVVVHSSGVQDEAALRVQAEHLPEVLRARYRLSAYLHEELASAMAAADLAVSRAGASVMGEYPFFGLPSLLVPYPHAGAHQERNADYMVAKGAAVKLLDGALREGALLPAINSLLDDEAGLGRMGVAARAMARPDAAEAIAGELHKLCSKM